MKCLAINTHFIYLPAGCISAVRSKYYFKSVDYFFSLALMALLFLISMSFYRAADESLLYGTISTCNSTL
jgi:hypothetical protein